MFSLNPRRWYSRRVVETFGYHIFIPYLCRMYRSFIIVLHVIVNLTYDCEFVLVYDLICDERSAFCPSITFVQTRGKRYIRVLRFSR